MDSSLFLLLSITLRHCRQIPGHRASAIPGTPLEDLVIEDKKVQVKGESERLATLTQISQACIYNYEKDCIQILAHATLEPTEFAPPWQAGFAKVEVDTKAGVVEVLQWITVHDIGQSINPISVEGQHRIPSTLDLPDYQAILVELGDQTGPFGVKNVGESGLFLQAPATANAMYDAVGVRIRDLPITPKRLVEALAAKGGNDPGSLEMIRSRRENILGSGFQ